MRFSVCFVFTPTVVNFVVAAHRPSPYVYLPFGLSHRMCIGRVFALVSSIMYRSPCVWVYLEHVTWKQRSVHTCNSRHLMFTKSQYINLCSLCIVVLHDSVLCCRLRQRFHWCTCSEHTVYILLMTTYYKKNSVSQFILALECLALFLPDINNFCIHNV